MDATQKFIINVVRAAREMGEECVLLEIAGYPVVVGTMPMPVKLEAQPTRSELVGSILAKRCAPAEPVKIPSLN